MTENMTVAYLEHTGHVLGAVAHTTGGDSEPDLETVVGPGLRVRNYRRTSFTVTKPLEFLVPPAVLGVKTVSLDYTVLAQPQRHVIDGGTIVNITSFYPPLIASNFPDLNSTEIRITHPAATGTPPTAPTELKVFSMVASLDPGNAERRIQEDTILNGSAQPVPFNLTILPGEPAAAIPSGEYGILLAVEGHVIKYSTDSAP